MNKFYRDVYNRCLVKLADIRNDLAIPLADAEKMTPKQLSEIANTVSSGDIIPIMGKKVRNIRGVDVPYHVLGDPGAQGYGFAAIGSPKDGFSTTFAVSPNGKKQINNVVGKVFRPDPIVANIGFNSPESIELQKRIFSDPKYRNKLFPVAHPDMIGKGSWVSQMLNDASEFLTDDQFEKGVKDWNVFNAAETARVSKGRFKPSDLPTNLLFKNQLGSVLDLGLIQDPETGRVYSLGDIGLPNKKDIWGLMNLGGSSGHNVGAHPDGGKILTFDPLLQDFTGIPRALAENKRRIFRPGEAWKQDLGFVENAINSIRGGAKPQNGIFTNIKNFFRR